ncbi:MAG: hypothetical protein R3E56_14980 [Burkholderiaceae bacterium]
MTFWLRRCTEQSRSPSATTPPFRMAACTSMWRAPFHVFLDEQPGVFEVGRGQAADQGRRVAQLALAPDQAHADAAATRHAFLSMTG